MDTADQKSNWAGSISEWWNYSHDSSGDSLYTALLTGPSGNDDGGRDIVPGPAKHNTPAVQPEFELFRLPALNITSMREAEDAGTVCELISE